MKNGASSKGGAKAVGGGRVTMRKGISRYGDIGKAISRQMIAMRLSGKTQQECEDWMEAMCQEIERLEGEALNGKESGSA